MGLRRESGPQGEAPRKRPEAAETAPKGRLALRA